MSYSACCIISTSNLKTGQLLGARSTQKLVKIHNSRVLWKATVIQLNLQCALLVIGVLDKLCVTWNKMCTVKSLIQIQTEDNNLGTLVVFVHSAPFRYIYGVFALNNGMTRLYFITFLQSINKNTALARAIKMQNINFPRLRTVFWFLRCLEWIWGWIWNRSQNLE